MGDAIPLIALKILSGQGRPSEQAEKELEKLRAFAAQDHKDNWLGDGADVQRVIAAYCKEINAEVADFTSWLARDWISCEKLESIVAGVTYPDGFDRSMAYGFSTCGPLLKFVFTIDMLLIASHRLPAASSLANWYKILQSNENDLLLAYLELEYLQARSLVHDKL